jgi:hypothetical protein
MKLVQTRFFFAVIIFDRNVIIVIHHEITLRNFFPTWLTFESSLLQSVSSPLVTSHPFFHFVLVFVYDFKRFFWMILKLLSSRAI